MFLEKYTDKLNTEMVQILLPDGALNEALRPKELTDEIVLELYKKMVFCRMCSDRALKMQRSGRMGSFCSVEGQEGLQIGSEFALKKQDWIVPAFRELAVMWAHGVPMENIFHYWIGNELGSRPPAGVHVLPVSIPVGSQMLHGVGLSWAAKLQGKDEIAVNYFGDGASSEGDFHEAMNFAGVFKTPTIFICQNNQYAISTSRVIQTASKTIAQKALGYGFPGVLVDGNDLFAMYAVTKEAEQRARKGDGPTLIEAYTYRFGDHSSSDDASKYRDKEEVEVWRPRDPMVRLQIYLGSKNLWSPAIEEKIRADFQIEVDRITESALALPHQTVDEIFDYTYAELPPALAEQKGYLKNVLAKKAAGGGSAAGVAGAENGGKKIENRKLEIGGGEEGGQHG